MNDERYVRKGYKIWDTYSDKEVQELNYRSQSDHMCEILNEKESRINTLVKENEQLKKENNDYEKQFRIINEKLDEYIKTADTYRIPISSLKYGDDLGYFNGVHQYMKKLKEDIEGLDMSEKQVIVTLEDGFGRVQTRIATSLSSPQLMDKIMEIDEQQDTIEKQKRIIKSQDAEISRQYNLCLAMSGILREEFGVYDVFDRTKDKNIKKEE